MFADVDTTTFLGETYDVENARLEVRFWYPADTDYEYYRINWVEPERNLAVGFHQDADHQELGPCHIQLDYEDTAVDRHDAKFLDGHPLAVLDDRLRAFSTAVAVVCWDDKKPSLPSWQM